jgi:tol-pal system protein YbgF
LTLTEGVGRVFRPGNLSSTKTPAMPNRPFVLTSFALACVLVSSPRPAAAAPDKAHLQLMADIRMLQEQSAQLQLLLASLGETLKVVTSKLDDQTANNRKALADQKLLIDNLSGDVRVVREKVDDTNVRITSLSTELEALRLAIPRTQPVTTMPETGTTPPGTTDPAQPGTGTPPVPPASQQPPVNPGISPTRMLDSAYSDYALGQWALAIEGYQNYIRSFPRSEQADDAQYMIGDAYYLDKKLREAIAAYDAVIKNYPSSNKLPDAYYKRGLAYEGLSQVDKARESFDFAARTYPDTDAGRLAKQRLDGLRKQDD